MSESVGVTFDVGQTLLDLDLEMLARRLAERGYAVEHDRAVAAVGPAWRAYDVSVREGRVALPWKVFMAHLIEGAGVPSGVTNELTEWLFAEQRTQNLWRREVAGMFAIVRDLKAARVPLAIVSNSEGALAEFLEELGHAHYFDAIADSGRLGIEKPDARIFAWAAERLALPLDRIVHIGDTYSADIEGALAVGMRAIWFRGTADARERDPAPAALEASEDVRICKDADEVRAALVSFGVLTPR